jgi:hypothetical protein
VTSPGPDQAASPSADAIDRLFARLFASITALSWSWMLLAELGWFRPIPILVLGTMAVALSWVLVERALREAPAAPTSRTAVLAVTGLIVLAACGVLPPGDPVVAGADESVYLSLASAVRQRGTILSRDALLAETPQDDWARLFSRDRFWPERLNRFEGGVQIADGAPILQPSFFHLLPVWMAGVQMAGGERAGALVAPAFSILGVIALFLAGRRLTSSVAAAGAAALVATSLGQAWCGRQPLSELPAQFFVLCGVWFLTWWSIEGLVAAAAMAGLAFGMAAFTRVDVLLLVTPVVIAVFAARWWQNLTPGGLWPAGDGTDRGLGAGVLALGVSTGHALVHALTITQPYTLRIGRHLAHDRALPMLVTAATALAGIAALLIVARRRQWRIAAMSSHLGLAIAVVTIGIALRQPQRLIESPLLYLLTGPGLILAAIGLVRWSRREDAPAWLVLLLTAASALAYLDMPRDLPDMPGVFRRTLPVLLPLAALLAADTLVPRASTRRRAIAGSLVLVTLLVAGARHLRPIVGQPLPSGSREAVTAIARDVPPSALVIVDRGLPSHLALALDFIFGRSSIAADFAFRSDGGDRVGALSRLMARAAGADRDVFFLAASTPSALRDALLAAWTPYELRDAPVSYSSLERRRGAWPARVQDAEHHLTMYRLVSPRRHVALPLRVDVGGADLALSQGGWLPAEVMLSASGRWTGTSAEWRFPAAHCVSDAPLFLRIRAATLRPPKLIQPRVRLALNGVQIGELVPSDSAFHMYALGLPSVAVRQVCTAPSTFSLETGTFVPARDAGSPDERELGLAVDWIEVAPDAGRDSSE